MRRDTLFSLSFVVSLALCFGMGCGRGSASGPRNRRQPPVEDTGSAPADGGSSRARDGSVADVESAALNGDGGIAGGSEAREPEISGRVVVLEGGPEGVVLMALPDSEEAARSAKVDSSGRFRFRDVPPATYRLILPADGVHSTADLYLSLGPDAGPGEVKISRGRGCPVKITVRDHAMKGVPGAELDLTLTDLPQVESPHVSRGVTDAKGRFLLVGSCVRGYYEGTLKVPGRGEFPVRHGYVGTGWDQFDIVLPEGADAGVSYTNDD